MNKSAQLSLIISRYDHYYDSVNNKGNFLIAFQSFLIGGVVLGNENILDFIYSYRWMKICQVLLFILVALGLLACSLFLRALSPYTKVSIDTNKSYKSLIPFSSVATFKTSAEYEANVNNQTDQQWMSDLAFQIHVLASGLNYKFRMLPHATTVLYIEGVIIALILLIIALN